jgi:type VI protein secretion system component VasF
LNDIAAQAGRSLGTLADVAINNLANYQAADRRAIAEAQAAQAAAAQSQSKLVKTVVLVGAAVVGVVVLFLLFRRR